MSPLNYFPRALICAALTIQLIGCGTILYPERKGQKSGRIDIGVALLDGIGLFFFLIPGIIAYAVDFSNGTIYLPATALGSLDSQKIQQVNFDPQHSSIEDIEKIISDQTGYSVKFDQSNMVITKLKSSEDIMMQFALNTPTVRGSQIALRK